MKKMCIVIILIVIICCKNEKISNVTFLKHNHNLGELPFRSKCEYVFKFTNSGEKSLFIDHITVYCDCVVAKWSVNEILPGETDSIIVYKNTLTPGQFEDLLIVNYRGSKNKDTLMVYGTIKYLYSN